MQLDRTKTVAEIVLDHPGAAGVFQNYRIDFCCRGGMSLKAACDAKGLDEREVSKALESALEARQPSDLDPRSMKTPELVEHIVSKHHAYLRETLPLLQHLATKVARVHGEHEPSLLQVRDRFLELKEALEPHLDAEEQVIFPMLIADDTEVKRDLAEMHEEHVEVGDLLGEIRTLAKNFEPPEWACTSYRTLMRELAALETDTFHHIHLENQVLMPRFT